MKRKQDTLSTLLPLIGFSLCLNLSAIARDAYDLSLVSGMEGFSGSAEAKELLRRNGFVVADPEFKQIFQAYIESPQINRQSVDDPRGVYLPSFITPDSAWHTYHVLLEEGVKELEENQSRELLGFSRKLLVAVSGSEAGSENLILFAAVGLGLQDSQARSSLPPEARRIVDGLLNGKDLVETPIGFPLSPLQFRAQSFYRESPELMAYFAARQWYSSVVFRLANSRETRLALALARVVQDAPELRDSWRRLSDPYDAFLAGVEDGTVRDYASVADSVLGAETRGNRITDRQFTDILKRLAALLPTPRVNDQVLSREEYADFGNQTKGLRLLPPRQLPCAICFQETVDPIIADRQYPSGLDFMAASGALRSPAAARAVQGQFGKSVGDVILKTDCGPLPNSLHGDAMKLLAMLQEPLPAEAPAALRTEAWSDLQLWTQLGAWAEQRHTWALHTKLTEVYSGIISPPEGMVAPYPKFFSGLAALARATARAIDAAEPQPPFDARECARDLLKLLEQAEHPSAERDPGNQRPAGKMEQLGNFQSRYFELHRAELENERSGSESKRLQKELVELCRRWSENGNGTDREREVLKLFFDSQRNMARLLIEFAPVCDRLADLAKKALTSAALTEDDARWIRNYGVTLARYQFYYGNSYEVPRDNFPMVTRVFSNPRTSSMLYAGLARPRALYVIAPRGTTLQLFRGAVMTYREMVRPNDQLLDDESWRELLSKGQAPLAPPFTRSFLAETSVGELLKELQAAMGDENRTYRDVQNLLWQISSRASEKDLPALVELFIRGGAREQRDMLDGLSEIVAQFHWESYQKQFIELMSGENHAMADAVVRILSARPEAVDATYLISRFPQQPLRAKRLDCAILSRVPQSPQGIQAFLLSALHDADDGVRWQAALAMGKAGRIDSQSIDALQATLTDTNEFVAAAAVRSLAKLGATNSGAVLLKKLQSRPASPAEAALALDTQARAITRDADNEERHEEKLLDSEDLMVRFLFRLPPGAKRAPSIRLPPQLFNLPNHHYDLTDALIEGLAELRYQPAADELFGLRKTDYGSVATDALRKLAPDRLFRDLCATAADKQLDAYFREQAMVTLANLSATNQVRELAPLLEDTTPIDYHRILPAPEWRVCDRAAETIARILAWEPAIWFYNVRPDKHQEILQRAREWAKNSQ